MSSPGAIIAGRDIIVFGEDFGRHPHALEHVMLHFLPQNRLIWVETMGLRSPKLNLYDLGRIWEKMKSWIFAKKIDADAKPLPKNLTVIAPFMLPYNQFKPVRKFNEWNVLRSVRATLKKLKIEKPLLITSVPQACDYVGKLGEAASVYFCVDEFALWPGLDYDLVRELEAKLIGNVDLITATASALAEAKRLPGKETKLITHGVDLKHFELPPAHSLKQRFENGELTLCYFGLFDQRSDQAILLALALQFPSVNIRIIGECVVVKEALEKTPNIKFIPRKTYQELPEYIQDVDIFILPYVLNELTKFVNPLKLKEYLATGRPVLATPLPEILKLKDFLYIGENADDFIRIMGKLIDGTIRHDQQKVLGLLRETESWEAKARLLSRYLADLSP